MLHAHLLCLLQYVLKVIFTLMDHAAMHVCRLHNPHKDTAAAAKLPHLETTVLQGLKVLILAHRDDGGWAGLKNDASRCDGGKACSR